MFKKYEFNNLFKILEPGASADPCSETYHGPTEMSEPESQLLNAYLAERASRVNIYIAFHSYGQYVLLPFGHNGDLSDNHENLVSYCNTHIYIKYTNISHLHI